MELSWDHLGIIQGSGGIVNQRQVPPQRPTEQLICLVRSLGGLGFRLDTAPTQ